MTKPQTYKPVVLATISNQLEIRPGLVKAMVKSGMLQPLRQKLPVFDPRAVCEAISNQSGNPVLIEKAQTWLLKLESEPQTVAVKPARKKRTRR